MDLKDSQYQAGLRLSKGAEDALQGLLSHLRKREDRSRLRRDIEEVESILKKVKRELGIG